MAKFTLEIDIGNENMKTSYDISDALLNVSGKIRIGFTNGNIRDINGNLVGKYGVSD